MKYSFNDLWWLVSAAKEPDRVLADKVLLACGWQTNFSSAEMQCAFDDGANFMDEVCWYAPGNKPFSDKWVQGHYRPNPLASWDDAHALQLATLPEWWLSHMGEVRTPVVCRGDMHAFMGAWSVNLQHVHGGRLTSGSAYSAAPAMVAAILAVKDSIEAGRWS